MSIARIFLIILISLILVGGIYFFGGAVVKEGFISSYLFPIILKSDEGIVSEVSLSTFLKKEIHSLPGPLVSVFDTTEEGKNLHADKIFEWTNLQRKEYGLPLFLFNETLSTAAEIKVDDMFFRKYFEHVSPIGVDIDDLMGQAQYTYISVGENLALGNFKDDEELVMAWMESPGHRANILNDDFTEIGISVKKGIYEGKEVWIAVQEFGRPRSDCPYINSTLLSRIEKNKTKLDISSNSIGVLQKELDLFSPKHGTTYNQKVAIINEEVTAHNTLLEETKQLIEHYNREVAAFNTCIQ